MTRARALAMLVVSAVAGYVVGEQAARARQGTRGAQSLARDVEQFGEEQAALRRVATLVALGTAPEDVFAAVTMEVGRLLGTGQADLLRYDSDGTATRVSGWSLGAAFPFPIGARVTLGGHNLLTLVSETGRPARIDDYTAASGDTGDLARRVGVRAAIGVPISVEGRVWGLMVVSTARAQPLPANTEARLAGFTELVATAIANAHTRIELRGFAEEQAALRRVATLVARAAAPDEVFAAVTAEVGRVLHADFITMTRYDPDGWATVLGAWSGTADASPVPVGTRFRLGGRDNVVTLVFVTGRPARVEDYTAATGDAGELARAWGFRASVAVPINVEGRLWGLMGVSSTRAQPLPADTEARLAGFTELVATALANAESQAQLTASRARIVAAADQARRRIERDLHDGAQQRLVSLAMKLRMSQAAVPPAADELAAQLEDLAVEANSTLDELRELARGIHPAILVEGGLPPALKALARRCTIPVRLDVRADRRAREQIEIAAYYLVAVALTNAAKHAHASTVHVQVDSTVAGDGADALRVCVRDNGRGGADLAGGSGLVGLKDRVEALGGRLRVQSVPGAGTTVHAELPLGPARALSSDEPTP